MRSIDFVYAAVPTDEAQTKNDLSLPIDKRRKKTSQAEDCFLVLRRSFLKVSIIFRYGDRELQ